LRDRDPSYETPIVVQVKPYNAAVVTMATRANNPYVINNLSFIYLFGTYLAYGKATTGREKLY
jgi:hypothetical protein